MIKALLLLSLLAQDDVIKKAFDGDAEALKTLRAKGAPMLRALTDARLKAGETKGSGGVADLVYDLKKASAREDGVADLTKMQEIRVTVDMKETKLFDVLMYLREITGIAMVTDSALDTSATVTLRLDDLPVRRILDALTLKAGFEYDARFGVLLFGKPERLWGVPKEPAPVKPLTEEQAKSAREWITGLGSGSIEERGKAGDELEKLGSAVIPLLEEGARSSRKEISASCRLLLARFAPKAIAGAIPAANAWKSQDLTAKEDKAIAMKLDGMTIDLNFDEAGLKDAFAFLRDFTGLNFLLGEGVEGTTSIQLKNSKLADALALMTLPGGFDVKIDGGVVTIYKVKK